MRAFALAFLVALCLPACSMFSKQEGPDPDDVPRQMTLAPGAVDLVELTFEASDGGYALTSAHRTIGAPTLSIVNDRDVLITARDGSGKAVHTVSVDNPRLVHTAGSSKPGTAVLPRATFSIRLPRPDDVRSVDVMVRGGPNERFTRSFNVAATDKPK